MENFVKQRIRDLLVKMNSNPTQLAKKYSLNQKTLNNQINSDVQLSASTILLVLEEFNNVSAEWLLRGKGNMLIVEDKENADDLQELTVIVDKNGYLRLKQ
ncbi:hypothetical protein [Bacteroides uniformis]|uniref:hypothetical protein n=1 Tax=Bacteroides uniformis TaxID=820 RepID=UPI001105CB6B|nr:hypothetical protein [Bacteroides uniformis]MDC1864174.1 hypothetical protein [Bacteroides uniformis]MDC1867214.1 hypothetical protein [Bacteroides uniformis]